MQAENQARPTEKTADHLLEIQAVRERLATVMIYVFAILSLPSVIFGIAKQASQGYWKFIILMSNRAAPRWLSVPMAQRF